MAIKEGTFAQHNLLEQSMTVYLLTTAGSISTPFMENIPQAP